jgi:hypothetical protein
VFTKSSLSLCVTFIRRCYSYGDDFEPPPTPPPLLQSVTSPKSSSSDSAAAAYQPFGRFYCILLQGPPQRWQPTATQKHITIQKTSNWIFTNKTCIMRTTHYRLPATANSVHSQLSSASGGRLFHPQPVAEPQHGDRTQSKVKVKVKLSLCLTKHTMKAYWGVEVQPPVILWPRH